MTRKTRDRIDEAAYERDLFAKGEPIEHQSDVSEFKDRSSRSEKLLRYRHEYAYLAWMWRQRGDAERADYWQQHAGNITYTPPNKPT